MVDSPFILEAINFYCLSYSSNQLRIVLYLNKSKTYIINQSPFYKMLNSYHLITNKIYICIMTRWLQELILLFNLYDSCLISWWYMFIRIGKTSRLVSTVWYSPRIFPFTFRFFLFPAFLLLYLSFDFLFISVFILNYLVYIAVVFTIGLYFSFLFH